jgi:FkbM family methyltransferase
MIKFPESDTFFNNLNNVMKWGEQEFQIIRPWLENKRKCIDIGAHCGLTSLRYAQYFKEVHSFEPIHYELLKENTVDKNITVYGHGISAKKCVLEIYPNPQNSGGSIIPDEFNTGIIEKRYTGDNAQLPEVVPTTIKCLPLDYYEFKDVDLIKIDVEGHILPVINGMINTLKNNSPILQIELSDFEEINIPSHDILDNLGYIKYWKIKNDAFYIKKYYHAK